MSHPSPHSARPFGRSTLAAICVAMLSACQTPSPGTASLEQAPLRALDRAIDLERFMGDWYVIAHIPTFIERQAYNAIERYELADDGTIPTTFSFNRGGFDGPRETYTPRGFVHSRDTGTEWRMRFVWPFKVAYLILYLDHSYETTVIGVPNRKYAWIMARTKTLPEERYGELVEFLGQTGHDLAKLRRVPHR